MNRYSPNIGSYVLGVLVLLGSAVSQYPQDGRPSFSETQGGGFDAPEFNLPDLYGLRHSSSGHRGKVLLLYFMGHD